MSDKEVTFSPPAAGDQGKVEGVEKPDEKQSSSPQYMTRDDLLKFMREQQAARQKLVNRAKKVVEQQVEALRASGVEVTKPQQEQLNAKAFEALDADEDELEPSLPGKSSVAASPAAKQPDSDPYLKWAREQAELFDTTIIVDIDPEAASLSNESETAWKKSYIKALQAKAQRASQSPASRIVSAVAGSLVTGGDLAENYRQEMLDPNNRGNTAKVQEIKERYRKRGLDVEHTRLFGGRPV